MAEIDKTPDALDASLESLADHDVDDWRREHVRARAHRAMSLQTTAAGRWFQKAEWIYTRAFEPALVYGLGSVYLGWAFFKVMEIF